MLTNLVSKVIGPKVMLGVIGACVIAVVLLTYLLMNARERAGQVEAERRELAQTVKEQEVELNHVLAENRHRERVVMQAVAAQEKAQQHARQTNRELDKALANDECAQSDHPDAVADSLRFGSNHTNQD